LILFLLLEWILFLLLLLLLLLFLLLLRQLLLLLLRLLLLLLRLLLLLLWLPQLFPRAGERYVLLMPGAPAVRGVQDDATCADRPAMLPVPKEKDVAQACRDRGQAQEGVGLDRVNQPVEAERATGSKGSGLGGCQNAPAMPAITSDAASASQGSRNSRNRRCLNRLREITGATSALSCRVAMQSHQF
jgi:hypothetical protein